MTKNRICAAATGLPKFTRRGLIVATAATPLAALPVMATSKPHDEQQEIDNLIVMANHTGLSMDDLADWFRGLHSDVTSQIVDNALNARVRASKKATGAGGGGAQIKRLSKEMSAALDQMAAEFGATEWQLNMASEDATGAKSSVVCLAGYEGQAGKRRKFSETVWVLD